MVRHLIKSSFSELSCFLMPPPGKAVTSKEDFDGKLQDIDEDFRCHLKTFFTDLLAPSKFIVKTISGNKVTGKNLLEYFHGYMDIFSSDKVPSPTNILSGLIKCDNIVALTDAKELYSKRMREHSDSSYAIGEFNEEQRSTYKLNELHEKTKKEALDLFDGKRKIGGDTYSREYREDLIKYIDHFIKLIRNESALQTTVQQIQSKCQNDMDKQFGDTPFANIDELESTYSRLVAKANELFHATADALSDADSLIQLYKDKLDRGMQNIYDHYTQLNEKKYEMEQKIQKALHEYKSNMETKFPPESDALTELEFQKAYTQIQFEGLNIFDGITWQKKLIGIYKCNMEKEMQSIVGDYEQKNRQKMICEKSIKKLLFKSMTYKDSDMSFMHKTKQRLWSFVGMANDENPAKYILGLQNMLQMRYMITALLLLLGIGCVLLQNPGNCPPLVALDVNNCREDRHCGRTLKCCATANGGKACVLPVSHARYPNAEKPGKCPEAQTRWICGHACTNDGDCIGRKKCCEVGCGGHWCSNPV